MFIRRAVVVGAVVAFAAMVPNALADQPGPSVTGSGQTDVNGANRTFTVDAHQAADGSVNGQSEIQSRQSDATLHVDVNCLHISGSTAYMSGTLKKASDADASYEGWTAVFSAQDNHGTSPDRVSLAFLYPPNSGASCSNVHAVPSLTVENGNITIHS